MTKKLKIEGFLNKTGKTYSCKSCAGMLRLKPETARKYLRSLYADGLINRIRVGKLHRYFAAG
jgi:Mn-dependent DtxR family transcriptional regulator